MQVAAVEQVIQVATKLVQDDLDGREAVTILATLTRDALPVGSRLRQQDPERADAYREILAAVERQLRSRVDSSDQPQHLQAVVDDLAKVAQALA